MGVDIKKKDKSLERVEDHISLLSENTHVQSRDVSRRADIFSLNFCAFFFLFLIRAR